MDAPSPTLGVSTEAAPPPRPEATPLAPAALPSVVAAPAWPRSAQWVASALLVLALGLLGWRVWTAQRWGSRPTELDVEDTAGRIDLNHADHAQLRQLPGVGDTTAARIEEYRLSHNGFHSVEELRKVHGVGPALLARLRPFLEVSTDELAEDNEGAPPPSAQVPTVRKGSLPKSGAPPARQIAVFPKKKADGLTGSIDVNHATGEELQRLPGIGPALSGRILQVRDREPFRSVDELRRVPGIGPKTLERLRPFVTVDGGAAERTGADGAPR